MNLEQLRKKHQELLAGKTPGGGEGGGEKFLKPEDGDNLVRILPWKDDTKSFYSESMIHRYTNEEGKTGNFYCRRPQNEKCPICDFYFDLWKMHKELGLEKGKKSKYGDLATQIKATPRYYMNAISRKALQTKPDDLVGALKIMSVGIKVFKKVMDGVFNPELMDEEDPENTNVLSLKKGNDFNLKLGKSGEYNNYDESTFRIKKTAAGSEKDIRAWMESLHDIHGLNPIGDYEEGSKIVQNLMSTLVVVGAPPKGNDDGGDLGESKFKKEVQV